ncbi:MAG: GIY-YIG nuclease family protein [Sulfolobus sp.]|jgi:Uri superfamily endonuclease
MKGYIVLLDCEEGIIVTKAKKFNIEKGIYAYVGSCGVNCAKRISRHLIRNKEKKHWHIDFLTELCNPIGVIVLNEGEKEIAKKLTVFKYVKGFGNSDDKENSSHLFKVDIISLFNLIKSNK